MTTSQRTMLEEIAAAERGPARHAHVFDVPHRKDDSGPAVIALRCACGAYQPTTTDTER